MGYTAYTILNFIRDSIVWLVPGPSDFAERRRTPEECLETINVFATIRQ